MTIYHQSAFDRWPVEDGTIQAIITSPPYWSLRRYRIADVIIGGDKDCNHSWGKTEDSAKCVKCGAFLGQYGLEPDSNDYIKHTLLWTQEAWRVLKDDGLLFLNLADVYKSSGSGTRHFGYKDPKYADGRNIDFFEPSSYPQGNFQPKSQMLIPHRVALALIDAGWILRNTIIWYKSNAMPESVKDRLSKKYEYVFMFAKKQKYKFNLDAIREPYKTSSIERLNRAVSNNHKWTNGADGQRKHTMSLARPNRNTKIPKQDAELFGSPRARYHRELANTGANNKEPYQQNNPHSMRLKAQNREDDKYPIKPFTTFFDPSDALVCDLNLKGKNPGDVWCINTHPSPDLHYAMWPPKLVERMILCSTDINDTVLDPFCGSGTTIMVATQHNRNGIGIDLGYGEIQENRIKNIQVLLPCQI